MQSGHEISCFITVRSWNDESYMFHTPNISLTRLQAEASGIPLVEEETEGEEETELVDLCQVIKRAAQEFQLDGIVTGAIQSVYQTSRIERICHDLDLWCISPLWLCNQEEYLESLIREGFEVLIVGVSADPLDESWLGQRIDLSLLERLKSVSKSHRVSLAGEGGEYESFVCNAPFFHRKIVVDAADTHFNQGRGWYAITRAHIGSDAS